MKLRATNEHVNFLGAVLLRRDLDKAGLPRTALPPTASRAPARAGRGARKAAASPKPSWATCNLVHLASRTVLKHTLAAEVSQLAESQEELGRRCDASAKGGEGARKGPQVRC